MISSEVDAKIDASFSARQMGAKRVSRKIKPMEIPRMSFKDWPQFVRPLTFE
jgi:hypothetical protein